MKKIDSEIFYDINPIGKLISVLASMFFATVSLADDIYPFSATCTDKMVKAYRYATRFNGEVINDEWSEGEKFQSGWHFKYRSGNVILLDGKPFPIVGMSGPCSIFSDGGEAPLWRWNLGLHN